MTGTTGAPLPAWAEDDPLQGVRRAVAYGGMVDHATLPALLPGLKLVTPLKRRGAHIDAVMVWGQRPSAERGERFARQRGLPLIRIEDAFLRSMGLGHHTPPLGIVLDDVGVYYDCSAPSRLERLILASTAADHARGEALIALWRSERVSKYNGARDGNTPIAAGDVLVVDQTAGDASIARGGGDAATFERMLEAALDEHPNRRIWLKVHPDVLAGRKRGHFGALSPGAAQRVSLLASPVHAAAVLEAVGTVYTVTSQMGFEALMWGKPVRCFGQPFYAGWGLTHDERPTARRLPRPLAAMAAAALADYARYIHPVSLQPCDASGLMQALGWQRRMRERFPPEVVAVGFSQWKKPIVRAYFAGSAVQFQKPAKPLPSGASCVAVWGAREVALPERQGQPPLPVVRLEDGFLRSVGLGADLVAPLSWVMDARGLYYDASRPSALEDDLTRGDYDAALLARAAALRARIVAQGFTKYNVGQGDWRRPDGVARVALVVGQVESDASIALGAAGLKRNVDLMRAVRARHPRGGPTWLLYKPHPDVVAQLREPGEQEDEALALADQLVTDVPMQCLLTQVEEVHVLTSLAGFEALLRGLEVHCWGAPFYAGWGLTHDALPLPRRGRVRSLDELVAAALIRYPTYVSPTRGVFLSPEEALDELQAWRARTPHGERPNLRQRLWRWGVRQARAWKLR